MSRRHIAHVLAASFIAVVVAGGAWSARPLAQEERSSQGSYPTGHGRRGAPVRPRRLTGHLTFSAPLPCAIRVACPPSR